MFYHGNPKQPQTHKIKIIKMPRKFIREGEPSGGSYFIEGIALSFLENRKCFNLFFELFLDFFVFVRQTDFDIPSISPFENAFYFFGGQNHIYFLKKMEEGRGIEPPPLIRRRDRFRGGLCAMHRTFQRRGNTPLQTHSTTEARDFSIFLRSFQIQGSTRTS